MTNNNHSNGTPFISLSLHVSILLRATVDRGSDPFIATLHTHFLAPRDATERCTRVITTSSVCTWTITLYPLSENKKTFIYVTPQCNQVGRPIFIRLQCQAGRGSHFRKWSSKIPVQGTPCRRQAGSNSTSTCEYYSRYTCPLQRQ